MSGSGLFQVRFFSWLYRHPQWGLLMLLGLPLLWVGGVYLGSLSALLLQSFFHLDGFTGQVVRQFTLSTYGELFTPANLDMIGRTVLMASVVTLTTAVLAFPVAYYTVFFAPPRLKTLITLAVILPLWANYLVRVYAWKLLLAKEGILSWGIRQLHGDGILDAILSVPGIGGPSLSVSAIGTFLTFVYVWLPYMVLPVTAALEKVPVTLLEASSDLGASPSTTFWRVTLPLAFPGVVAGSIFTFSLTLGDFVVPSVLGNSNLFIGQAVLAQQGSAGNIPLAAALTMVPMVIMGLYLWGAKRLGGLEAV